MSTSKKYLCVVVRMGKTVVSVETDSSSIALGKSEMSAGEALGCFTKGEARKIRKALRKKGFRKLAAASRINE